MRRLSLAALAVALLVPAGPASAHPVPFSYLDLHVPGERDGAIDGTLVVHIVDAAHDLALTPPEQLLDPVVAAQQSEAFATLLRARLHVLADGRELLSEWGRAEPLPNRQSIRIQIRFLTQPSTGASTGSATGSPRSAPESRLGSVAVVAALFPYDPAHQTFLNVYEGEALTQTILDHDRSRFEYFTGTRRGAFAVVKRFLPAGIYHILRGPDHLVFLVGLMLLGGTIRRLVLIATSFTVAHSVTLSLAALNVVSVPERLIEPAIALCIVYVGVDNLLVRDGRDVRAWMALAFGSIHGLGFASVLREMGLPMRALVWSVFSFNAGVEIGQLLVVAVVASALAALRSRSEAAGRQLAFAGSVVVAATGAFWFVRRVFFPGSI